MAENIKENKASKIEEAKLLSPEENYIKNRLLDQVEYYDKSSKKLQREYYAISITSIVILAIIPVITLLPEHLCFYKYLIAGASAILSMLNSILLVRKTKDNWLEYRTTSEALQSELEKYRCCVGSYNKATSEERFRVFVETCEKIMSTEHVGWYTRMKADSDQG